MPALMALYIVASLMVGGPDARRHSMPGARASTVLIGAVVSSVSIVGVASHAEPSNSPINTVREVRAALRACGVPPSIAPANMRISVRLSFKQNGEILGIPLITYTSLGISEGERRACR